MIDKVKGYVSIIVPVYNAGKYIKKCVSSIKKQTFDNWKLILVNDVSTDNSGKICDELANTDNRIQVIHQTNKGCLEARKTGVFSDIAKLGSYIMFCDADDMMPVDAIEKMYNSAELYNADLVCGKTVQIWKGIKRREGYKAPCFNIDNPALYNHDDIIEKLFISYFGKTDFPASLFAKLYKTDIITKNMDFEPIVKFMGEDLSVNIRVLPKIDTLVIIPDEVYFYRIGGGTGSYKQYFLDDFLALYHYKKTYALQWPMPQNWQYLMNVELINIVKTHFQGCMESLRMTSGQMNDEIRKVCEMDTVREVAEFLVKQRTDDFDEMLLDKDIQKIYEYMLSIIRRNHWKRIVKNLLFSI